VGHVDPSVMSPDLVLVRGIVFVADNALRPYFGGVSPAGSVILAREIDDALLFLFVRSCLLRSNVCIGSAGAAP